MDAERLRRTLGDPSLERLVERLARRIELGRPLTGSVRLPQPSPAELRAVRALLGSARAGGSGSVAVPLSRLADALAAAGIATDLRSAVEALAGPITPRSEAAASEEAARRAAEEALEAGRHSGEAWFQDWARAVLADGTLTRLIRKGDGELLAAAVAVLDLLPASGTPLPVLAERATGDTKALSGTPLAGLVLRALAHRSDSEPAQDGEDERALWESAGGITDDLSSHVLVLGLRARDAPPLSDWLTQAAERHTPFRATLHQIVTMPIVPAADAVFVCENPSVLRAAVSAPPGAPLVCTEGVPSAACRRLLRMLADRGAAIRWRGDFDWTGLRTTSDAVDRYGADPWRMSAAEYTRALERGDSEPLRGAPAESPWEPALAERMREAERAVMEERMIPLLLRDLADGA
ncbi:TIGR02679 family protein [Nocardiopsis baichengensis]|uniref:TIGR02679 family protein n=1 Tax=Nocardiopsis baichengensis TaxID=280240 RepID=UPI00034BA661|nr:TIGR02679 family protein [Nocardiopsis baichengensis]